MVTGTNPVSGEDFDASDPTDWKNYAIGGIALMAAVTVGRFAVSQASDATNIGDTVSEAVLEVS